ncbi:MAG: AraC family transcriptional regulator [bacterium]|nr:AraC family transcriptional regulator [bacterium]
MSNSIHETKTHGQLTFPYIIYRGNIPKYLSSYPLHWHEEFEIVYIVKGKGLISIQSQNYVCTDRDILLISPGQIHSFSQYEDAQMEYFNLLFRFSLLEENINAICYQKYLLSILNGQKRIPSYLPSSSPLNQQLTPYLTFLIANRKRSYTDFELLIKSNLYAILHYIKETASSATSETLNQLDSINKMKPVLEYVHQNYSYEMTVKKAASIAGFSESHFMKVFKTVTGKRFTQYVTLYRLEVAARELRDSNQKIIEIAENVGFHNLSYFIRTFTKRYGISPSAYRSNRL